MTGEPRGRPLYLDTQRGPVFGILHTRPSGRWSGTAVVFVGPWGWDEVVTNRSRKAWAEHLVAVGHAALRIDLPGSGDSGGDPADPGLVDAWVAAVAAAVQFARGLEGCRRVAVIGMGLGGVIAGESLRAGSRIDDLVLWGVPTTGRAFVREARAFSSLQTSRFTVTGEPEPALLPDGWMEVGGFVLSAETMSAVSALALTSIPRGTLQRALLLERDGLPVDGGLRDHLAAEGVRVAVSPGEGWAAMCFDIEQHRPPLGVFETVAAWLNVEAGDTPVEGAVDIPIRDSAEIGGLASTVRESPFELEQPFGRIFGIMSEPSTGPPSSVCAVFLNAGAVRRIGPNRMWVEAARRWAARGVPSLRLDVEGIGEADGDPSMYSHVRAFYRPAVRDQVVAALDALEARGFGRQFVLTGLCAGAYWAFRVAQHDERVVAVSLFNPRALVWDPHLSVRREARAARKVLTRESWERFMRGEIKLSRIARVARAVGFRLTHRATAHLSRILREHGPVQDVIEASFDRLSNRGTNVLVAFSKAESLGIELEESGLAARFDRWPGASFVRLPGRDHTVRPIVAQRAVQDLIDEVLGHELEESAATPAGAHPA